MIIQIQNILQESKNTIEKTIKSEQITKNLNAVVEIIFNAFSEEIKYCVVTEVVHQMLNILQQS